MAFDATLGGWAIFAVVVVAYAAVVLYLHRARMLGPDRPLSLFGPALMIKTRRGRTLLERAGRFHRLWSVLGDVGIALAAVSMVIVVVLLFVGAITALSVPAAAAPSPQEALGIPGINPIIPISYGIIALVVGIALHELMHGVMARSQKIGVKSIGVLILVVPIGAFVEQDEQDMGKAPRRHRDRVAAAGVLANLALAAIFSVGVAALVATTAVPNATGVGVGYVLPGTPAANASLSAGDILTAVNGTTTMTNGDLFNALSTTHAGQTVSVTYYSAGQGTTLTQSLTLAASPSNASRGFLGIGVTYLTPPGLVQTLTNPFASPSGPIIGFTNWLVLPIAGLQPISGSTQSFYHLSGPLAPMGSGTFWFLVNTLYWLAWINLLLGVSNALPLVPLDGGLLFRDFAASLASRVKRTWSADRLEKFAGQLTVLASVTVLFLLVWQFVVPRLH